MTELNNSYPDDSSVEAKILKRITNDENTNRKVLSTQFEWEAEINLYAFVTNEDDEFYIHDQSDIESDKISFAILPSISHNLMALH